MCIAKLFISLRTLLPINTKGTYILFDKELGWVVEDIVAGRGPLLRDLHLRVASLPTY